MTRAYFVFCFEGAKNVSHRNYDRFQNYFRILFEKKKQHIENKPWKFPMTFSVYHPRQI